MQRHLTTCSRSAAFGTWYHRCFPRSCCHSVLSYPRRSPRSRYQSVLPESISLPTPTLAELKTHATSSDRPRDDGEGNLTHRVDYKSEERQMMQLKACCLGLRRRRHEVTCAEHPCSTKHVTDLENAFQMETHLVKIHTVIADAERHVPKTAQRISILLLSSRELRTATAAW